MAVTAKLYLKFPKMVQNKEIDVDSDTLKVMLLSASYTPDQDNHDYLDDVSAYEISGTGYTAGGATLTTVSISLDTVNNRVTVDADDVSWTDSTITDARYAVIYDDTPATEATKPLIGYIDFGENKSSVAAPFNLNWNAAGIWRDTVS